MRLRVTVTESDIRRGTPASPKDCPVAIAVRDELESVMGQAVYVSVGNAISYRRHGDMKVKVKVTPIPMSVHGVIYNYDMRGVMYPFCFALDVDV